MVSGTTISHCHRAGQTDAAILSAMLNAVETFAAVNALQSGTARRLAIIVEELVVNLVCHAGHGRDIVVSLGLAQEENGTLVTLEDNSDPFDLREATAPEMPDPDHGGGVGLALVKAWAEVSSYARVGERNRLILRLRAPTGPSG